MGAERQRAEAKHTQTQATQDTLTRDRPQPHPHKSAKATGKQATADNRRPGEAAQWGPARHPSKVVQTGPAQTRVTAAQGDAELPERPRDEGVPREAKLCL
jgi:hypothetical protein